MGWNIVYDTAAIPDVVAPGPVWTGLPTFAVDEGAVVAFPLPVDVSDNSSITVEWLQPLPQPSWILLGNGVEPNITFQGNQQDANDLNGTVLIRATANGQFADSGYGTITINAAEPTSWTVTVPSFTVGDGGTFDISTTGPSGYATGGVYDVDVQGTALPAGMSLSAAGVLSLGTAESGAVGVKFGYTEPGALPILTLHGTGTDVPWMATVYPAETAVPSGMLVESADDTNLKASVLSTWPDGSAQVMVLAGQTTVSGTKTISLRPAVVSQTPLTTAAITAAVSSVSVNFGTAYTLSSFTSPDWIWWQNAQVICARYRIQILNKSQMEAVIDIHAFAGGRAFVEVVIENGKIAASDASPTKPATQTYTGATVAVNGTTIATVNSPSGTTAGASGTVTWSGGHEAFRAWYCAATISSGTVTAVTANESLFGLEVTHDTVSMQALPYLLKPWTTPADNLATKYASTTYTPWRLDRIRVPNMSGTGGADSIGLFTVPQCEYIATGSKHARKVCIVDTLQALGGNLRYRDSATNLAPHDDKLDGKRISNGTWPATETEPMWEDDHQPAIGMMAFMCRPSPIFIEIAQGAAVWGRTEVNAAAWREDREARGRAWRYRAYANAILITPTDGGNLSAWKAGFKTTLKEATQVEIGQFRIAASNPLSLVYDYGPANTSGSADKDSAPGFQCNLYFHYFLTQAMTSASQMKLLSGAEETAFEAEVDYVCRLPVQFVNDAAAGEWRKHEYTHTVGTTTGGVPTWAGNDWGAVTRAEYGTFTEPGTLDAGYSEYWWASLCAAVERGVTGADTAWARVVANTTNLTAYRDNFATNFGALCRYPRNKP